MDPGKKYGSIRALKVGNPIRVITRGCGTAIENLSFFVEHCLYSEVLKIECRVKDIYEMLTIIDKLNKSNTLTSDCRLASFDIINMFPSLDKISGLKAVRSILDAKQDQFSHTDCIIEAINCVWNVTILFLITNISYRVTIQHKVFICHVLIPILPFDILIKL